MPDGSAKPNASAAVAPVGTSKILTAMNKIMARVGYVQKQGENKFHGYKYAGEGNLLEVLRPAMVEEGLLLIPSHAEKSEIDQHGNVTVLVEYTLAHKDGEVWPEKIRVYGSGNDRAKSGAVGDKGIYKAATGANKYLLFKLFQIETGDDPEKDSAHDKDEAPAPEAPAERQLTKQQARPEYDKLVKEIQQQQSLSDLAQWGKRNKPRLDAMPADWQQSLKNEYADHKHSLEKGIAA